MDYCDPLKFGMISVMIATYLGAEFFKLQHGETVVAFNPPSKESKLKSSRFGADVVFVTLHDSDMNGSDTLGFGDRQGFLVDGPGEYEVKGIFINGFISESMYGGKKRINTIYRLTLDGMEICFLGALSGEIDKKIIEDLDTVDILFVPIGGEGVLDPASAYKTVLQLEPKIVIPMHYGEIGGGDALKRFLKEGGSEKAQHVEKLTVKKKDIEGKEAEIIVIDPA